MQKAKTIFVTGATGNIAGALARNLLNKGFHVKALVRDPGSAKAKELQQLGIEIIKGDLDKPAGYENQLKNADGFFCLLTEKNGIDKEVKQGKSLVDLAKKYSVPHFIYSSVIGADLNTGIPHWESKFQLENYIKASGLPYTIVRPTSLYENFLIPQVKKGILKGKMMYPLKKETVQQMIGAEDVGRICAEMFMYPEGNIGKTIDLAAEEMSMQQAANTFSETMVREIKYGKLPGIIIKIFMGKKLYKMFTWVDEHNAIFVKDLAAFKNEFPNLVDLKTWIEKNFSKG